MSHQVQFHWSDWAAGCGANNWHNCRAGAQVSHTPCHCHWWTGTPHTLILTVTAGVAHFTHSLSLSLLYWPAKHTQCHSQWWTGIYHTLTLTLNGGLALLKNSLSVWIGTPHAFPLTVTGGLAHLTNLLSLEDWHTSQTHSH